MPSHSTKANDEEIARLYQSGLSMLRVAQHLGVSVDVVRYRLEVNGVPRRSIQETKLASLDTASVVALYAQGLSQSEVARQLNTTPAKVQYRLEHAGIPLRTMAESKRGVKQPKRMKRVDWTCPQCHTTITLTPFVAKRRKFCSRRCASHATPNPLFHKKERHERVCRACQQSFSVRPGKPHQRYCGHACAMYDLHQKKRSGQMRTIERIVEALLVGMGEPFHPQWRFATYSADIYLPLHNIAIECDGDYWHSLPTAHRERLRKERAYRQAGILVLHLTEGEILHDIGACKEQIIRACKGG